jgi:hypothetical protein
MLAAVAALGCTSMPIAQRQEILGPTSRPVAGGGVASPTGGDVGLGLHYESILPLGVAVVVVVLAMIDKVASLFDNFLDHKREMARIKRGGPPAGES